MLQLLRTYKFLRHWLIKFLEKFVVVILVLMVVVVFSGIVARSVLKIPMIWTEELALISQIWLTFMGSSLLYAYHGHMVVDAILNYISEKNKLVLAIINQFLVMPLFVVFIIGGMKVIDVTSSSITPGLGVTVSIMYVPAVLGGFFMLFFSIDLIIEAVKDFLKYRNMKAEEVKAE